MDDNNQKPTDDNLSLDDMMAQAVGNSEEPKTDDEAEKSSEVAESESSETSAPAEENTEEENAETVEASSEEAEETVDSETVQNETTEESEETSADMIDQSNQEAKEEASDAASKDETPTPAPLPARKEYNGKWYIVHTYSGHENKVAKTLMQRVQAMGFESTIYDALVPTRDTIRVRGGKKETIKEKIFPGYILVNMDLSDEAWVLVRTTPGVTSFVGAQNKPTPIRDDEVQAIVAFVGQKDPVYKAQFSMGEAVKITDGPFSDFLGTVESIDEAKGKIKVLVSIFGRETPVELDFLQVAKI